MKTKEEIEFARQRLAERFKTPGLGDTQLTLLAGMVNALCWVSDSPDGGTLERLLTDEPMSLPPSDDALARLRALVVSTLKEGARNA